MEEVVWMFCTECKRTVLMNNAGICLACQGKYNHKTQPDSWENMHICKKCGSSFPFLAEGCVDCKDLEEIYDRR